MFRFLQKKRRDNLRFARKHYCPGCGRTKPLFSYEIQEKNKVDKNGKQFDKLIMKCISCGYTYNLYSETDKPQHWGRAKVQGLA